MAETTVKNMVCILTPEVKTIKFSFNVQSVSLFYFTFTYIFFVISEHFDDGLSDENSANLSQQSSRNASIDTSGFESSESCSTYLFSMCLSVWNYFNNLIYNFRL